MSARYNENDPAAAHVLRCLVEDGIIAPGTVDDRSIKELTADDLRGFAQVHLFAGAGTWSVAARLAGWPDNRPLWTASCPCQPFSAAGKGLGTDDPRHLWPDLYRLIRTARDAGHGPSVIVGEQVAGSAGYAWFDGVRADLAREGFAARVVDFPALAVDAPHERNRLYWVAMEHAASERRREGRSEPELRSRWPTSAGADASSFTLADGDKPVGVEQQQARQQPLVQHHARDHGEGTAMGNRHDIDGRSRSRKNSDGRYDREETPNTNHPNGSFWSDHEWLVCHDGKARRTKPGLQLLVNGLAGRIPAWRLAGNSIVAPAAIEVLAALREVLDVNEKSA